jgi:hypothetical protein
MRSEGRMSGTKILPVQKLDRQKKQEDGSSR